MKNPHIAFYISNKENKSRLVERVYSGELFPEFGKLKGELYSKIELNNPFKV